MSESPQMTAPAALSRRIVMPAKASKDALAPGHWWTVLKAYFGALGTPSRSRKAMQIGRMAVAQGTALQNQEPSELEAVRRRVSSALRRGDSDDELAIEALALVREVARRTLGITAYVQQLAAGYALWKGQGVEMATGEGKTLAAAFPAALFGLAGRAVHVVTSNDYLAERDLESLTPLFQALGLTTGLVVHDKTPEERRLAYAADIAYGSNKEIAFDYLRDRLLLGAEASDSEMTKKVRLAISGAAGASLPIQRGLDVAIVDEVDSVLIDEAAIPLVISAPVAGGVTRQEVADALELSETLAEGQDYFLVPGVNRVELTDMGRDAIEPFAEGRGGAWRHRLQAQEMVKSALTARHCIKRDRQYIVKDGKIVIVDEHTGRPMPDRFWDQDLHAMVEFLEGCESSGSKRSLAGISFQRFFRRYRTLAGMSGTVSEVANELAWVYGLPLTRISRRRASQLRQDGRIIFASRASLWEHAANVVRDFHAIGRPVLVGVASVAEADMASDAFSALGLPHRVLSAAQDRNEAEAVAEAGKRGAITIATSMAGRGTDIKLGDGVAGIGGLVVLLCQRHDSRRVDRQLIGRCARQGDPGSWQEVLSAEDPILEPKGRLFLFSAAMRSPVLAGRLFDRAQRRREAASAQQRRQLMLRDDAMKRTLAFAGGLD